MKKNRIKTPRYVYWKRKANTLETILKNEIAKNNPLKDKLLEQQEKLIILYEKRVENNKAIKELKERVSNLEQACRKK